MATLSNYKVNQLRKMITGYNKIERKRTYSGVWRMKKNELINLINSDFKPVFKKDKKNKEFLHLKHKSGRYTKKIKK
jgi:hypothetical protein